MAGQRGQIGTIAFDLFAGTVDRPAEAVEGQRRPGRDLARWGKLGLRAAESQLETTQFVAPAAAGSTRDGYKALAGTAVTIWDACGVATDNCRVLSVRITGQRQVVKGGSARVKIAAAWTVQAGQQTVS